MASAELAARIEEHRTHVRAAAYRVLGSSVAAPEEQTVLGDAIGPALLVVLQRLDPAARLALCVAGQVTQGGAPRAAALLLAPSGHPDLSAPR